LADDYQVLARKDSTEVPFATVFHKNSGKGTYADESGKFKLKIHSKDTLVVSSVGYKTKTIPGHLLNRRIFLDEQIFHLDEIVIKEKSSYETLEIGFHEKKNVGAYLGGHSVALWIPNTIEKTSYIKKFLINLDKSKVEYKNPKPESHKILLRIRLSFRNAEGAPSEKFFIPNEFIVEVLPNQEKIIIDALSENLKLPKKGVFLIIDFMGYFNKHEFVPFSSFDQNRRIQYQAAISHKHESTYSWVKEHPGSDWKLLDMGPGFNFNFGLQVVY